MQTLFFLLTALAPQDDPLSAEALRADLQHLSADAMEGRSTGSPGAHRAADWIVERYKTLGLQPLNGSYRQAFPAEPRRLDLEGCKLQVGDSSPWEAGDWFLPHPSSPPGSVEGELVFVGYGLDSPEHSYNDFAGLDLEGKVALLLRWEPQAKDPKSPFDGKRLTPGARLSKKVRECEERGASAVLIAAPPGPAKRREAVGDSYWPNFSKLHQTLMPMLEVQAQLEELSKTNFTPADVADQLFCMLQAQAPLGTSIPVAFVGQPVLETAFSITDITVQEWVQETDRSLTGMGFPTGLPTNLKLQFAPLQREGVNLFAVLPGSDPVLSKEIVVLGAHYDHVGMNEEGEIWNGADDNGSGAVALLALAKSFVQEGAPKRTLLFIHFSGEEIGLLGAAWFLSAAHLPRENITAMVNMDMIGRSLKGKVHVLGTKSSPIFPPLLQRATRGLDLYPSTESEEFFDRSDQVVFYLAGIPVIFFNTDEHEDYHTPRDTWERIHYPEMAAITTLARRISKDLANITKRPIFTDGYHRLRAVFGKRPKLLAPWPVPFEQRLDY